MPIVYYEGVEGSGKSVMMGRDLYIHHQLVGPGKVFAFPGFDVFDEKQRKISQLINPFEMFTQMMEMYNVAIGIDEVQNFINHHNWWNKIIDILTYGIAAQRRKRSLAILMTGPIFEWLPKDFQRMVHEVVHMQDRHWKVKAIPRGEQSIIWREDKRGALSGDIGRRTRPQIFHTKRYWQHIDTWAPIDVMHQFEQFQVVQKKTFVEDGRVLTEEEVAQMEWRKKTIMERFGTKIQQAIEDLRSQNITSFPKQQMWDMVRDITGMPDLSKRKIGEFLSSNGVWLPNRGEHYIIETFE